MSGFRGLQARISPNVDLRKITITLDPHGVPLITLEGRVSTGNRRVDNSSSVTINTMELTEIGASFIREMKSMFTPAAQAAPPPRT